MVGRKVAQFLMVFENNFCFLGLSLNDVNMRAVELLKVAVTLAVNLEVANVAAFVPVIIDDKPL